MYGARGVDGDVGRAAACGGAAGAAHVRDARTAHAARPATETSTTAATARPPPCQARIAPRRSTRTAERMSAHAACRAGTGRRARVPTPSRVIATSSHSRTDTIHLFLTSLHFISALTIKLKPTNRDSARYMKMF